MKGWIVDFQANGGPDYSFRKIVVIVDSNEENAKRIFIEGEEYPNYDEYLEYGFEEMVYEIIEEDPEDVMKGAGWDLSVNNWDVFDNVPSSSPSYKDFYFDTEGDVKDLFFSMFNILPSINQYIEDKLGVASRYKIDDLLDSIIAEEDELAALEFIKVPGISTDRLLKSMSKAGIMIV